MLKVIIVDNSPLVIKRVKTILSDWGHVNVMGTAGNISDARNLIERCRPHVVIIDIEIDSGTEGNGMELLAILKNEYSEIKTIVLTNYNKLHYRLACMEYGANYFFDKSYDFNKIPEVLEKWIQKK